jgi:hypothetical protein
MVDAYLNTLIFQTPFCPIETNLIETSEKFTSDAFKLHNLQYKIPLLAKHFIVREHLQLIIDLDDEADKITQKEDRAKLLKSWESKEFLKLNEIYKNALDCVLESELALAYGPLTALDALYHRTRCWLYRMIFILKEEYLSIFLNNSSLIEYSADLALVVVLLDDAEDAEEDLRDDCPTFFTMTNNASTQSLSFLSSLSKKRYGNIFFGAILDIQEFIYLAVSKINGHKEGIHLRTFFKIILEEKNWRGKIK